MNATRNKFNWPSAWKQFKLNLIVHKDDTSVFFLNI
jgi:hypothetical protein